MYLKELDANLIVVLDALLIDASVTRAAERLGRSPSAVSHALSNLREIFGDELFVRAGQRLVPTARARSLAPAVHVIVSGMESLLRPETPFEPATLERTFMIACSETREVTLLGGLQKQLAEVAPSIQMRWQAPQESSYVEDLRSGHIHFLIYEGAVTGETGDICVTHLCDDGYVVLARAGHELTKAKDAAGKLGAFPHVLVAGAPWRPDPVRAHLAGLGIDVEQSTQASSILAGLFLARESDHLIVAPQAIAEAAYGLGLVAVAEAAPRLTVPVNLCWHRSHDRDECHQWMGGQIMRWHEQRPA
ncbi:MULTISPECIES: LysR substrate-binding domain-containing protein [Rhodomicrobium]|uniref:LysR substrate-binding domain-containing protein n=1 Tax=Rhodomicrobium TaxID=1068 RepID=UPI000B4B5B07|nr:MULTISPECIES: LysR substrate-binding domain-containing protein [Rhodomicrobium]